jgi:hypothetical protein
MKKTLLSTVALIAISTSAQNVGINSTGANADPSSILDVTSADKGLLIPRVNIADLTTIAPITGGATTSLMVYNTNAGTGLGYFYWDGNDWIKLLSGGNVDNGLYFNGAAQRIRLGGPLVEATTITQGTNAMTFNLNSTGDFNVQDNGTTRFQVLDNGRIEMSGTTDASGAANTGVLEIANSLRIDGNEMITNTATTLYLQNDNDGDLIVDNSTLMVDASLNRVGVGTTAPTYELDVVGNIGHNDFMYHNDDADTYVRFPTVDQISMYAGNVRMLDMVEGGTDYVVFNENSADVDFRIESDGQTDMFFIDAGNNRLGLNTLAPATQFHFIADGSAGWSSQWVNPNASGTALFNATNAANGSRTLMGITNYSNSAFQTPGIMGLSLNATTTGSGGVGVIGAANNESGTALEASLFFAGGYAGWALYTNADTFTPGGNWTASDKQFKKEIKPIDSAIETLLKLDPVSYKFDTDKYPGIGFDEDRLTYGFIAQDLEQVIPEMVKDKLIVLNANKEKTANSESEPREEEVFKVVNYTLMVPILTQAIKEQQVIIEDQNKRIEALEKVVLELQNGSN